MASRRNSLKIHLIRWVIAAVALAAAIAATSAFRAGIGWGGRQMLSVCHGGIFYVETPKPDLHIGLYLRREEVYLDWKFEAGNVPGLSKYVFVPLWPLALVPLVATAVACVRERMHRNWQCQSCRYDLRGIAASTCPECGAVQKV